MKRAGFEAGSGTRSWSWSWSVSCHESGTLIKSFRTRKVETDETPHTVGSKWQEMDSVRQKWLRTDPIRIHNKGFSSTMNNYNIKKFKILIMVFPPTVCEVLSFLDWLFNPHLLPFSFCRRCLKRKTNIRRQSQSLWVNLLCHSQTDEKNCQQVSLHYPVKKNSVLTQTLLPRLPFQRESFFYHFRLWTFWHPSSGLLQYSSASCPYGHGTFLYMNIR
jgi:hypothetical protein